MRIAISIPAALLVTLVLFFLMQAMIKGNGQLIEKPEDFGGVDFVRLERAAEEPASQPRKSAPLPKQRAELNVPPPAPQMTLAAVQPPAAVPQHEPFAEPVQSLQLGEPYLGPSTTVIPKAKPAKKKKKKKRAAVAKIKTPRKPVPARKNKTQSTNVANAPALEKDPRTSTSVLGAQRSQSDEATAPGRSAAASSTEPSGYANEAVPVFRTDPKYPRKAARNRIEGWVKLEFTITEKGTVTDAVVVASKPRRTFDRSAVKSIRKWRFKPRVVDGKPVQRKASQIIEFKLAKG